MADFKTISGAEAWREMQLGALLVNGFEDNEGWYRTQVSGALSMADFKAKAGSLSPDQQLMFYCDCADDGAAKRQARALSSQGYSNVRVVKGGFRALTDNDAAEAMGVAVRR